MDIIYKSSFNSMIRVIAIRGKPRNPSLNNNGISVCDYGIFQALDEISRDIVYDIKDAIIKKGRPLSVPELLCYSSHFHVWKSFIESGKERLVVIEDDVSADWTAIESILNSTDLMSLNGMVRLFTRMPARHHILGTTENRFVTKIVGYGGGAQGYILSRDHAFALFEYCKKASRPIDDQIDRYWDHGVNSYCIYPFPIMENVLPSTVQLSAVEPHGISIYERMMRNIYLTKDNLSRRMSDLSLLNSAKGKHFRW